MKTLKDIIIARRCRKGPATAITAQGAYWLALEVIIARRGGDGIGNSSPDIKDLLELRHFRDGTVTAVLRTSCWHQNSGVTFREKRDAPELLGATSIEELIQGIHATPRDHNDGMFSVGSYWVSSLVEALPDLPAAPASPDEDEPKI